MVFHFVFIGMFMLITVHDADCGEGQIYEAKCPFIKAKVLDSKIKIWQWPFRLKESHAWLHMSKLVDLIQKQKYNRNFLGWRRHMFDWHMSKLVVLIQKHMCHNDLLGWRSHMFDWHMSRVRLWIYSHCWTVSVNLSASVACP